MSVLTDLDTCKRFDFLSLDTREGLDLVITLNACKGLDLLLTLDPGERLYLVITLDARKGFDLIIAFDAGEGLNLVGALYASKRLDIITPNDLWRRYGSGYRSCDEQCGYEGLEGGLHDEEMRSGP